jgi:hypothetical protein
MLAGLGAQTGGWRLRRWAGTAAGPKGRKRKGLLSSFFLIPFKTSKQFEFKPRFEFNHSKQCTSMYAKVNSYISLIN